MAYNGFAIDKYPDAEPYYKMGVSDMSGDWGTGFYFQHDFFIVYDLAVGGRFTGILNPNGITALDNGDAKMYIDWVRVYQPVSITGIENFEQGTEGRKQSVYDLQGRKIYHDSCGVPYSRLPKGIYIINGKKTVVR